MAEGTSKLKGNILALVIGGVVSLLFAELALQIYNPIKVPVRGTQMMLPKNTKLVREPIFDSPKFDREIHVSTNSLGFRGEEPPGKGEERIKIFTIGGSTTECKYNSDDKTWSALLAQRLQESNPKIWLNNAGLDGNSTFGHKVLLEQIVLDLKPDYLLFLIGINDVSRGEENAYDTGTRRAVRDRIIEKSEILSTAQAFWRSYRARDLGLGHFPPLDLVKAERVESTPEELAAALEDHRARFLPGFEARVKKLVELSKSRGATPVLITQPSLYGDFTDPTTGQEIGPIKVQGSWSQQAAGDNARSRGAILELYNEVTRKVGQEEGLLVIDLAAKMPKDSALYFDWMHFSNQGTAKVAEIVADALVPRLRASR